MVADIAGINQRTQLAGNNRLEILMFHLGMDRQLYGINVFKVQEVIVCPEIRKIPDALAVISGLIDLRGKTMPVIDLAMAVGKTTEQMDEPGFLIVSEYNQHVQAFRVSGVDRIVNMSWNEIKQPPKLLGKGCYLTAIAQIDDEFVEMIDVEKVISEFKTKSVSVSDATMGMVENIDMAAQFVLIVDDSNVAIKQMSIPFDRLGIKFETAKNGSEALEYLNDLSVNDPEKFDKLSLIISDLEMPLMDGYTLVSEIRKEPRLKNLYVILHSSLSGQFNKALVEKVGANQFIPKFDADILGRAVIDKIINH